MEPLSDPRKDRKVKNQVPPPQKPLDHHLLYPKGSKGKPDWKVLRDHLSKEGHLDKKMIQKICSDVKAIFKSEGNLLRIADPITVVGDIHGQFYDFLKILEVGGPPEKTKYLFLGDFVDRGTFSVEVLLLLFAIKTNFPETMCILRGNHECRQMTSFFNFRSECLYKYDQETYDWFCECFDAFPLCCVLNGKFLAVHGGISPDLKRITDLDKINRF